ncbi:MAG: hypothetical protein PVI66_15065 [Candidatus Aminicenantes bacterium]|jgi:hypothetical protein
MDENKKVVITDELMKCLEVLQMAESHLPEGDFKESYIKAVSYIGAAFRGEELPRMHCPGSSLIIR